jgi:hypothetical protein
VNEIAAPNSDGCHSALARLRQQMRAPQCRLLLRAEEAEMADALQADLVGS